MANEESDVSLELSVADSSFSAGEEEDEGAANSCSTLGSMPYRFEPYQSSSSSANSEASEVDESEVNVQDDQSARLENIDW